jgi:hypothetical protein
MWLLLAIIISGIIQAIYGNLQLLGYYPSNHTRFKFTGSFFNPGPYAGFLASIFPIALGLYLFRNKLIEQLSFNNSFKRHLIINNLLKYIIEYFPLVGVISIILIIPATQSRASWLAVLISSIFLFELRYRIIKKFFNQLSKIKKVFLIAGTILIISISLFSVYHFKKGSSDGRLFIWEVSTEIIKDNPLFGVGIDRFKAYYMNYQASYFVEHGEKKQALVADNTYYAFNEFIQFITEEGVFGFVILISVLYAVIKTSALTKNNYLSAIIKVSLLSISVSAFFSYSMEILPIKIVIVVLLVSLVKLDQKKIKISLNLKLNSPLKLIIKTSIIGCVLLIIIPSLEYVNKLSSSMKNWKLALTSYQYGNHGIAIQEYQKAYSLLNRNGEFLMNYGKALSIYKQEEKAIKVLENAKNHLNTTVIETTLGDAYKNKKQYIKAERAYKHAASMIPSRFYPLYLLAKLYEESGQDEKAIAMALKILNKEVKIPSTAINEIQQEMKNILTKNPQGLKD